MAAHAAVQEEERQQAHMGNVAGVGRSAQRSDAAARARASIPAGSTGPFGTSQEPPTQSTGSSASQAGALAWVIPPVGQKRAPPNGPASAFRAGMPPGRLGREEFEVGEAEVEAAHQVCRGGDARQERDARVDGGPAERLGEAGRDDELGAGGEALLELAPG